MRFQNYDPYINLKNYECYITIFRDYGDGEKILCGRYVFSTLELALEELKEGFFKRHYKVLNRETGELETNFLTVEEIIPNKYYKVIQDTKNCPWEVFYYKVSMFDK